ncbi:30S ribosomal protein S21 [Candidatus Poribacteria bacterium]|nr:30S ribosomal protein S21 [Candidatus Poribacteria bacterium]
MLGVKIKNHESLDSALKRFKKKCEKSGLMFEMRKRECYEKPSDRRKRKAYAAQKAREKEVKTQE